MTILQPRLTKVQPWAKYVSSPNEMIYFVLMATDDYFAATPAKNAAVGKICLLSAEAVSIDVSLFYHKIRGGGSLPGG